MQVKLLFTSLLSVVLLVISARTSKAAVLIESTDSLSPEQWTERELERFVESAFKEQLSVPQVEKIWNRLDERQKQEVGVLLALKAGTQPPRPQWWGTVTASYIAVAFWTGPEPHFGAFFLGRWGHNQHYLGPGGDAATCGSSAGCISNWNWWGADRNVLLLPKWGWLWTEPPWGPKWQPAHYQAQVWID